MRSLYLSSAYMLLAAISCEHGSAAVSSEPTPELEIREPVTLALHVYSQASTPQTHFSIAATRDLNICSSWSGLEGEHFETRRFYAPHGQLYYEKLIAFSTDIAEPHPLTQPVSIPHALAIMPVVPNERAELVVCDQLAVAGAWIGDHQLTGEWRLDVSLDGAKTAAHSVVFALAP